LLRWFVVNTSHTAKCWICEQKFAQLKRGDTFCAPCEARVKVFGPGDCKLCEKQTVHVISDEVPVCIDCATDPSVRARFVRALLKGQAVRQVENDTSIEKSPVA
jgi:predicted amidophosphoribosyltransferase